MGTGSQVDSGAGEMPLTEDATAVLPQVGNGFPPPVDRKQPGELGDEQLAQVVSDGLVNLAVVSERLKPYFFELRERFHKKDTTAEIHGCRTWDEFCTKVLKRTRRAVNYLLSGGNPASKRNSQGNGTKQQDNEETSSTENDKPSFAIAQSPIDGDVTWSKQDASRRMLTWNVSCLKSFSPTEKREVAEDLIAKLRDEIEFEAPQPPPMKGAPVPEPDPGTLEEVRQRVFRMADVEDIQKELEEYTTELLAPVLATHPYAVRHRVGVYVRRPDNKQRIAIGDWLESVEYCGDRLKKLIGHPVALGRVVSFDQLNRPKVRWHDGQKWNKPYSRFDSDGKVRVLFDWQAAEKYPEAFGTYPSDPKPPDPLTTAMTTEQEVVFSDGLVTLETQPESALGTAIETEADSQTLSCDEQAEEAPKADAERNKKANSEAKAHEFSEDVTETTPHGYYARLNRKPKGATQESQPWEVYRGDAPNSEFCCRERNRQDAEVRCWKLNRMAEEEKQSTQITTNNEAAEAAAM